MTSRSATSVSLRGALGLGLGVGLGLSPGVGSLETRTTLATKAAKATLTAPAESTIDQRGILTRPQPTPRGTSAKDIPLG